MIIEGRRREEKEERGKTTPKKELKKRVKVSVTLTIGNLAWVKRKEGVVDTINNLTAENQETGHNTRNLTAENQGT